MNLPYFQGAFLYILALTFPFFVLILLIPGKASSFFAWMGLWFWVKFWDLGWAFVMVIDDLLWEMMPHSAHYDPGVDPNDSPMTVLETAFTSDPSYSTGFYYNLIGILLTLVPIISAQVFLGSKVVIAQTLLDGAKMMSEKYGRTAELQKGIRHTNAMERLRAQNSIASNVSREGAGYIKKPTAAQLAKTPIAAQAFAHAAALRAEANNWEKTAKVAGGAAAVGTFVLPKAASKALSATSVGAAGQALIGGVKEMQRLASTMENEAFRYYESERAWRVSKTKTDANLQSVIGATRGGRIGQWFAIPSPDELAGQVQDTINQTQSDFNVQKARLGVSTARQIVTGSAQFAANVWDSTGGKLTGGGK